METANTDDTQDIFVDTDEPQVKSVPEKDLAEEESITASLSDVQRRSRWQARRPVIEHLKDGVMTLEDGEILPLFDVGTRIVVDCSTKLLDGQPWLQTIVGKVHSIDDDTGLVSLYDEEATAGNLAPRWVSFKDDLHIFKLAPEKGDPFAAKAIKAQLRREAIAAANPGEKRGRGRPKGSKNRPKEVIKAEKETIRQLRLAKRR